jgi:release factor family 3
MPVATVVKVKHPIPVGPFRAEELERLLKPAGTPCISIHLPTHRGFPGWKQDPVRFRALVGAVEKLLAEGPAPRGAARIVAPLRALEDSPHWEYSLDGFAAFLSPDFAAAYRLPIPVPERTVVADTFHVKPLIPFLHANRRYLVLAVSENEVTLYDGGPLGVEAVELRGVPESLREALGVPDYDRLVSRHGAPSGPVLHGRGPGREITKTELLKYFRRIDKALHEFLRGESAPLVLAAVDSHHPLYRETNTYPHLISHRLVGSYERTNGARIHAEAWPIVSQEFKKRVDEWIDRYREVASKGLTTDVIEEIGPAAVAGRVACVLAEEGAAVGGILDRATGSVLRRSDKLQPGGDDLVDDVCEESLKRRGLVFVIPRASMPTSSPIAAVLRY